MESLPYISKIPCSLLQGASSPLSGPLSLQRVERVFHSWEEEVAMMENAGAPKGAVFNLADHVAYADGSVVSKTLLKKNTGTITLFSFAAGQGLSEHTAPFDAVVHILDGRAEITIGGKPHEVKSGEMLIMPAHVPHALHAAERFKMLLVMIRGE